MLHYLKLQPAPFEKIKSGKKDIELRLNDEKRQSMMAGDIIEFTCVKGGERLYAIIVDKTVFASFKELFAHYNKARLGYESGEDASPLDMEIYYCKEEIECFGALAIEIRVLNKCDLEEGNLQKLVAQYAPNNKVLGVNFLRLFYGNSFKGVKKFSVDLSQGWFNFNDNGNSTLIKQNKNSKELIAEFKQGLSEIDFAKWQARYLPSEPLPDADGWELELRFYNGERQIFSGVNAYPKDWNKLLSLLGNYTKIFK
ncbi:MAG: hypothetical protein E7370_03570 [Clostridiales bacterium]|nr:hypothetical protein [Clostridiales bacterium]